MLVRGQGLRPPACSADPATCERRRQDGAREELATAPAAGGNTDAMQFAADIPAWIARSSDPGPRARDRVPSRALEGEARNGWTEVLVLVPCGWEELVGDVLAEASGGSVALGPLNLVREPAPEGSEWVRTALPPSRAGAARLAELRARLAGLAKRTGAPELDGLTPFLRDIPPEDWANSWKKTWKPFRVGRLCVVAPHRRGAPRAGDLVLELEPGGTFGTGRHPTTRACLALAQELVRPGARVLDAGTGTGILAVAAALLGARSAFGFDVDESSRPAAEELARRNGAADRCAFRTGGFEVLGERAEPFDGLFANLYSDLLQRHARDLAEQLVPGGWAALSGCPAEHLAPTLAALESAGLAAREVRRRGRWCTVSARRG